MERHQSKRAAASHTRGRKTAITRPLLSSTRTILVTTLSLTLNPFPLSSTSSKSLPNPNPLCADAFLERPVVVAQVVAKSRARQLVEGEDAQNCDGDEIFLGEEGVRARVVGQSVDGDDGGVVVSAEAIRVLVGTDGGAGGMGGHYGWRS